MKRTVKLAVSAGCLAAVAYGGSSTALGASQGSGASFPALAYTKWCQDSGLCSYTSKGSGGGITDFTNGVVDFAASDAPLTDQQLSDLAQKRGGVTPLYFPTLLGAVTVPTNLEGVSGRLKLDGKTLGGIFSGSITSWSDPKIAATNKGTKLPAKPITVCVRADASGTSFVFSRYLTKVSADFKNKVNFSTIPPWTAPNLVKGNKNPGVADCIKQNSDSIGYVDVADAQNAGLTSTIAAIGKSEVVKVRKRVKGKLRLVPKRRTSFILPSPKTIALSGNDSKLIAKAGLTVDLSQSPVTGAYPISNTTWILAYSDFGKAGKDSSLPGVKAVLNYVYGSTAQGGLTALGFAPLPKPLVDAAKKQIAQLK